MRFTILALVLGVPIVTTLPRLVGASNFESGPATTAGASRPLANAHNNSFSLLLEARSAALNVNPTTSTLDGGHALAERAASRARLESTRLLTWKATTTTTDFDPLATDNLAVYFGHSAGNNYASILDVCTATSPDIIVIGFVRGFNGPSQPPTVDFGSRCKFVNGLAGPCPSFAAQVQQCQQQYQKKIFISVGGSSGSIVFDGEDAAIDAARILWNTFGAGTSNPTWRPFNKTIVDGFDVDHESGASDHYDTFAQTLRMYFAVTSSTGSTHGEYFISAAPSCANTTKVGALPYSFYKQCDFVWARFYNSATCQLASSSFTKSLLNWYNYIGSMQDPNTPYPKLYIGALSFNSTIVSGTGTGYVDAVTFANTLHWVWKETCANVIGGTMLWDGTFGLQATDYGNYGFNDVASLTMQRYTLGC